VNQILEKRRWILDRARTNASKAGGDKRGQRALALRKAAR
jgi:hypothetical protein